MDQGRIYHLHQGVESSGGDIEITSFANNIAKLQKKCD